MTLEGQQLFSLLASSRVPDFNAGVLAARNSAFSVGGKRHGGHVAAVSRERGDDLLGVGVPDFRRCVLAAGDDT